MMRFAKSLPELRMIPQRRPARSGMGYVRRAVADNAAVPRLAAFYGIIIWMYRPDHPPPHIHAQYGDDVAQIELATLRISQWVASTACAAARQGVGTPPYRGARR